MKEFPQLTQLDLSSNLSPNSREFKQDWLKLLEEHESKMQLALSQGKEKHVSRHLKRGYLLARERIELVLDPDSPFLELMPLAGYDIEGVPSPGASVVTGIGLVCGIECAISANIPTLDGGASNEYSVKKALRLMQIIRENRLPSITFVQTAGANLTQQSRVFHEGGAMFRQIAQNSKAGIPSCAVVCGSSTAGGAYSPGMSDYVIMVKNQAQVFLGGPPLVQMATGEQTDAETLGGAEMHSTVSGVSDQLASNEREAIRKARAWIDSLQWSKPLSHTLMTIEEPLFPIEDILELIPVNIRIPYDSRILISRLVDGSRFLDFKPLYGPNLVCGWAYIHGIQVGILANNNVLFPAEANKATQFIHLSQLKATPLVFLQNITGFMVGQRVEQAGIIKAGAQFINAVANTPLPAITIITGAAYGAGNYAMCGRAYGPRFLFSWPQSRCSVMGADQLVGVLEIVAKEAALKAGREYDPQQDRTEWLRQMVNEESDVYWTSARILDDGVIDPRDTRSILAMTLDIIQGGSSDYKNRQDLRGVSRL